VDRLDGKVALITGGASGIGLATARRFLAEGAVVYISGRRQEALDRATGELGANARAIQADASDLADLDRLYAAIEAESGRVDVVFANAGVGSVEALGEITEEEYQRTFDINVKGVLFTVQKALPLMPDGGAVILNASISGFVGQAGMSVYGATKAAVRSFARGWTNDLRERRIRVNAISPGVVITPGYDFLGLDQGGLDDLAQDAATQIPRGRIGTVEEIAAAVAFLASEDSGFVSGAELVVDGGMTTVT